MRRRFPIILGAILTLATGLSACTTPSAQIIRTLLDPAVDDFRFSNVLVISVAGDFAERLQIEQGLSAALTNDETTASPYYAVIGRNPRVTRNLINTAIQSRQFDSVLIVRTQGQDIPNAAPGRPTGRDFQLFLYDYDEFNRPTPLPLNTTVTFVSEFYAAASEKKLWGIESLSFDHDTSADVIELQVNSIAAQIRSDRLIAN